jgi:hypothetical protein
MRGDSLAVEIYQVDDPAELAEVAGLARQVSASQASATRGHAMQSYVRGNLLILVREEPEPGMIAAALAPAVN